MKVALIIRSTWEKVPGGDTVQAKQTAKQLKALGVQADVISSSSVIDYSKYDLLHFFNIIRPADMMTHIARSKKPFVLSPILIDYREFDRYYRKGVRGFIFRLFSPAQNEYIKTIGRWLVGNDSLCSKSFIWKGQTRSIKEVLKKAEWVLPNSNSEHAGLIKEYGFEKKSSVVPNGINPDVFQPGQNVEKIKKMVLCVARFEGNKNQFNLIRALNNTEFTLYLIGYAAPNQKKYYEQCRAAAAANIHFVPYIPLDELLIYYKKSSVHILPSWYETCGLTSLEAAALGCKLVITNKGYTRDYFGDDAFYCDPGSPESILDAVRKAEKADWNPALQQKIFAEFTWKQAAIATLGAYKKVLKK